nr:carcinoembryonic antigen-related cell adhesion molecule 1 isoform X6 [Loxodonta africana]
MEPPSASPRRGGVHWQGSLLTVSLLIFWSPSIPAQPTIESVPLNAAEGNDVLLLLSNPPEDIFVYIWYKGESTGNNDRIVSYASQVQIQALGPAYTGRETIYHNGSLLIQNVTLNHSGVYTLQITTMFGPTEIAGQIRVYPALPTPFIISNSSNPVEDQDSVTLTCYPETQNTTYLWLINNQSLPETDRLELSSDNRTLTVYSVTRNDTGSYECRTRNEVNSRRSDPFILNVLYGPDTPTISPSYWYYPPGANLILSCNATSNPPAQYSWLINGTYLQSTQVLFIPNITASHSGNYTCHVHNNATGFNRTTVKSITVSELPTPFITSNHSNPVEDQDSVTLTCGPDTQDTTYLWLINNQSLPETDRLELSSDNRTLTVHSVTRNDTGPYECRTWNQVNARRSDPFILNVLYGPDTPTISPSYWYYPPGANLILSCNATSNPPAQYSWLINGTYLQSTQVLFIPSITVSDSGNYTCHVHNNATGFNRTTIKTITVSAELPTPFITSNHSNPVEDQDSVTLTCGPDTQDTTYLWLINNQSLPETDRLELSSDNRTLTVHSVTRNDTGPYECRTWNQVNARRSDPFILNVLYGPDTPTISPSYWYYPAGANLTLSCNTTSNPPAQYSWLINGNYLQSTQVLFIPSITVSGTGNYTCLVYNNATDFNRTTVKTITVYESVTKPSIQASSTTVTENEGPVTLTCLTNHAEISIRWIFKGQILPLTERTTLSQDNSSLTIDPIRREDTGEYQCEVYNPVSSNKSDPLNLTVTYPPPEIPGLSGGAIAGIVVGAVAVVAVVVALVYFLCIRNTARASDQRDNTEHKPSASNHSQDHSDTDNEVAYSSLNFKAQQPEKSTSAFPSPTATETIYSEVKKK